MDKRSSSKIALTILLVAVLLSACGPGTAQSRGFYSLEEYAEVFKDLIMYPTYMPPGYDFYSGEVEFDASASYKDPSMYKMPSSPEIFTGGCSISISKIMYDPDNRYTSERVHVSMVWELSKTTYSTMETVEHGGRTMFWSENVTPRYTLLERETVTPDYTLLEYEKKPNIYGYYYGYSISYYILENEVLYGVTTYYGLLVDDEGGELRAELRDYCMREAAKVFDSLVTYDEIKELLKTTLDVNEGVEKE